MENTNVAASFFMPPFHMDDFKWASYGIELKGALYYAEANLPVEKEVKQKLRRLDSLLTLFMKELPVRENEITNYMPHFNFSNKEFPSESELRSKFFDFIIPEVEKRGATSGDMLSQYKAAGNATADCQRVIQRIIHSQPLDNIPGQVKTFENLLSNLSYSNKDTYFSRHPYKHY